VKIEILYQTQYTYAEPVSFSPHVYRLFPKADRDFVVRRVDFQTNAEAIVNFRRDLFDNEIASCFYPDYSALLAVNLRLELDVREKNAFGFLLAPHALDFPFTYTPEEMRVLAPYLRDAGTLELPFWKRPRSPVSTIEMLVGLNRNLREHLAYERRDHGAARTSAETLAAGGGACRDFAVLLATTLRALGIATRLASGYLSEFGVAERRAEGSLHAWTEAYLPGAGWVGFDPTNGVLCNHHHVTAAVGLDAADIAPVSGRYFHSREIPAQMLASLKIHEIS
jgi:transglutaminase-like putative cysteine protease